MADSIPAEPKDSPTPKSAPSIRDNDIHRNTEPIKVEQTGEHDAICTHEDGSQFEFTFPGQFPSQLKKDGKNPGKNKFFGGIGEKTERRPGKTTYVYRGGKLVPKEDGVEGEI